MASANGGTSLHSPVYHLLPADMRVPPAEALASIMTEPGSDGNPILSSKFPTLLLFECVLAYMSPEASDAIVKWFVDYFSETPNGVLGSIVYEMFGLEDSFGKVMLNNLKVGAMYPLQLLALTLHFSKVQKCIPARC